MQAYIKILDKWCPTSEPESILRAPMNECVFADNPEDAMILIDKKLHNMGSRFTMVQKESRYLRNTKKHETKIIELKEPQLKDIISPEQLKELIEEHGPIKGVGTYSLKSNWGKSIEHFGFIYINNYFYYNPKKAKKKLNWKLPIKKPRKHFITISDLRSLMYNLADNVGNVFNGDYAYKRISFDMNAYYKSSVCENIAVLIRILNALYGKNSHRHIERFQWFKNNWKKQAPKSAARTIVTKELFEFMEKEIKIRKPPKKELKVNKNYEL